MKEYYRPDEVATILQVNVRSVYNYIRDIENPLPASKINGVLRIKKTELDEYIQKNKIDTTE